MEETEEINPDVPVTPDTSDDSQGDPLESYYNYLRANHADVAPTFDSFKKTLQDPEQSFKYYHYVKDNGFDAPDSYDSFVKTFGLGEKKNAGGSPSSSDLSQPSPASSATSPGTIPGSDQPSSTESPANPFSYEPSLTGSAGSTLLNRVPSVAQLMDNGQRKQVVDQYSSNPNADPAIVKGLTPAPTTPTPDAGKSSVGDFIHDNIFLPLYKNSVGLINNTVAGAIDLMHDMGDVAGMHLIPDGLKKYADNIIDYNNALQPNKKDDGGIAGEITSGVSGAVPYIFAMPERGAQLGAQETAALLNSPYAQSAYRFLTAPIVKLFAASGAAEAYHTSSEQGDGLVNSLEEAAKGGVTGAENALSLEAQSMVAGAFGKNIANGLAAKGLFAGGKPAEALINALAFGTTFAGTSAAQDLVNGDDPDKMYHDALTQFGVGIALGVPEATHKLIEASENNSINKNIVKTGLASNSVQDLNNANLVKNLSGMSMEDIHQINSSTASPDDLYSASLEVGSKAYDESDPETKKNLMLQQLSLKNQGDIKRATQKIIGDPGQFASAIVSSGLPPDDQLDLLNKITVINKQFNPVELQKTDIGKNINDLNDQIKQVQDALSAATEPGDKNAHIVNMNDLVGQRVKAYNDLLDLNVQEADRIANKHDQLNVLDNQRAAALQTVSQVAGPVDEAPFHAKIDDQDIGGPTEDDVKSQINAHFDDLVNKVNNPPAADEAQPEQSEKIVRPAMEFVKPNGGGEYSLGELKEIVDEIDKGSYDKLPEQMREQMKEYYEYRLSSDNKPEDAQITPVEIKNDLIGHAQIIGYDQDGNVKIRTPEGEETDITPADRSIVGITNEQVDEFRQQNGIDTAEPPQESQGNDEVTDLAKRLYNGDTDFSDADQRIFSQRPDDVAITMKRLRESDPDPRPLNTQPEEDLKFSPGQEALFSMDPNSEKAKKASADNLEQAKSEIVHTGRYRRGRFGSYVGPKFIMKHLAEKGEDGTISKRSAELGIALVKKNPELFNDLALHAIATDGTNLTAGVYISKHNTAELYGNNSDTASVHEMLHHTERFLPDDIRQGILTEWHQQLQGERNKVFRAFKREKDPGAKEKLGTALRYLGMAEVRQASFDAGTNNSMYEEMKKMIRGPLSGTDYYKFLDPSEWWTENASRKFGELHDNEKLPKWVQKAWNFYNGLLDSIREVFGTDPTHNVQKGLDAVLKGDTLKEMHGELLNRTERAYQIEPEKRPLRSPGEPVRDYVKRVNDFLNRSREAEETGNGIKPPGEPPKTYMRTIEYPEPKWDLPDETREELAKRKLGDHLNRQETVQRAIEMAGGKIDDTNDYHTAADLQGAKITHLVNGLFEKMIKSPEKDNPAFFERLKTDGLTHEELDKYVIAAHAEEYNHLVGNRRRQEHEAELLRLEARRQEAAARNNGSGEAYYEREIKKIRDQSPDKNGTIKHELMDDGGIGMTNAEARDIIDNFKKDGKYDLLKKYGDEFVKEVSNKQLDYQVESGTLDKSSADRLKKQFENYVPTHVEAFLEEKPGKPVRKNSPKTLSKVDNIIRRAKGSVEYGTEQRVSPTSYGLVQLERAYHEGEINKSSNILYNLVEQNPNDNVFEILHPKYSPIYRKDGTVSGFREITDPNVVKNSIQLYRDGQKVYINLKDPILRNAIARNGIVPSIKAFNGIQNYYRKTLTELNPPFWVLNTAKHMAFAGFNLTSEGKTNIAKDMLKNSVPAIHAAFQWSHGSRDGEWAPFMERYLAAGGKLTGIALASDVDKMNEFKKAVEQIGQQKNLAQYTRQVLKYVGSFGDASGVGPRLAIFRSAVENGMSDMQAAKLSREAAVNFNKKGEWSGFANSLYLMFNSHAQSVISLLEKTNKKTARKILAGSFAMGILNASLNHYFSNEDDDPISEYDKQNNLIFKNPYAKGYVKIPVYSELLFPYYVGVKAFEVMSGQTHAGTATLDVFKNALTSFTPARSTDLLQIIAPTPLVPLVQYKENKNAFGSPIYKDPEKFGITSPSSHTHFEGTPPEFVNIAQGLNAMTGGTGVKSGMIDLSPDAMQWMYNVATNGMGKTIQETGELGYKGVQHAEQALGLMPQDMQISPVQVRDIPLLRSFYTQGNVMNYRNQVYDILGNSGNHELSAGDWNDFFQALTGAVVKGQITPKQMEQYKKELTDNQVRIQYGDAAPDLEKPILDKLTPKKRESKKDK